MGKIFPVCSWYNEKDLAHIFWVFKTMPNIYNGAFLVKQSSFEALIPQNGQTLSNNSSVFPTNCLNVVDHFLG